ncbi:hypothetical protein M427DRAFT_51090 [Gonapodya prolifera JEL478]|uniref:CBS domain-containing protein n=1 Tax=Gonapodya prolifera (strain JEL478) TaxID=1344416 RepID=A0A139AY80_GONPJ|nr:hypothetical protein M427DRAFT_51090 [Gonapodya prolifera JEL478]|eukprot:KXS21698.1 hypothetical protein M427DRAFT_51090 [Gonapodya prolifera JEL478]
MTHDRHLSDPVIPPPLTPPSQSHSPSPLSPVSPLVSSARIRSLLTEQSVDDLVRFLDENGPAPEEFLDVGETDSLESAFRTFQKAKVDVLPVFTRNRATREKEYTAWLPLLTLLAHAALLSAFTSLDDELTTTAGPGAALDLSFPHTLGALRAHVLTSLRTHLSDTVRAALDSVPHPEDHPGLVSSSFSVFYPSSTLWDLAHTLRHAPHTALIVSPSSPPRTIHASHFTSYLATLLPALPRRTASMSVREATRRARRARGRSASVSLSSGLDVTDEPPSPHPPGSPPLRPISDNNLSGSPLAMDDRVVRLTPAGACVAAGLEEMFASSHASTPIVHPSGSLLGTLHPLLVTQSVPIATSAADLPESISDVLTLSSGNLAGAGSEAEADTAPEGSACTPDETVWDVVGRLVGHVGEGGSVWIVDQSRCPVGELSACDVIEVVLGRTGAGGGGLGGVNGDAHH